MSPASDADSATIIEIISPFKDYPGALLPMLHAIQNALTYIPETAIVTVADTLNLSVAEVHGTASFYHHFRRTPRARHTIKICRGESCQAVGGRELEASIKSRLGIDYHETSSDGVFGLEPVYCLGHCACSPALQIDDTPYAKMDTKKAEQLISGLCAGLGPEPGPDGDQQP